MHTEKRKTEAQVAVNEFEAAFLEATNCCARIQQLNGENTHMIFTVISNLQPD